MGVQRDMLRQEEICFYAIKNDFCMLRKGKGLQAMKMIVLGCMHV